MHFISFCCWAPDAGWYNSADFPREGFWKLSLQLGWHGSYWLSRRSSPHSYGQWFMVPGVHESLIRSALDRNSGISHCLQDRGQILTGADTALRIQPYLCMTLPATFCNLPPLSSPLAQRHPYQILHSMRRAHSCACISSPHPPKPSEARNGPISMLQI